MPTKTETGGVCGYACHRGDDETWHVLAPLAEVSISARLFKLGVWPCPWLEAAGFRQCAGSWARY